MEPFFESILWLVSFFTVVGLCTIGGAFTYGYVEGWIALRQRRARQRQLVLEAANERDPKPRAPEFV